VLACPWSEFRKKKKRQNTLKHYRSSSFSPSFPAPFHTVVSGAGLSARVAEAARASTAFFVDGVHLSLCPSVPPSLPAGLCTQPRYPIGPSREPPPTAGHAPSRATAALTHLFEAEGHGEDADPYDAVHHVRDQPPV
jgi:hypothetical protein